MEELKYCYKYPHPAVTTDSVIFGFDGAKLKVLLIERGQEPHKGKWAFPGGFVCMDESCEEGALRELQEETNMSCAYMEQFRTYSNPNRDPREDFPKPIRNGRYVFFIEEEIDQYIENLRKNQPS